VADAGGLDFNQHLAFARALKLYGHNLQRLTCGEGDGGANIHGDSSFSIFVMRYAAGGPVRFTIAG